MVLTDEQEPAAPAPCLSCSEPAWAEFPLSAQAGLPSRDGAIATGVLQRTVLGGPALAPLPEAGPGAASGPSGTRSARYPTDSHLRGSLPYQLAVPYARLEPRHGGLATVHRLVVMLERRDRTWVPGEFRDQSDSDALHLQRRNPDVRAARSCIGAVRSLDPLQFRISQAACFNRTVRGKGPP